MPVFWFALSQLVDKNWPRVLLVFGILHLLVYPASNGYNSYMDCDEESIGGLRRPMQPTLELFHITVIMDILSLILSILVSPYFTVGIAAYILASRAYSYRGIRLKKYPIPGYLTVVIFQGAVTFFLVYHGCHSGLSLDVPVEGMVASSLLIGGFYPLTQIYQHDADRRDDVRTLSALLGYRGTLIFSALIYFLSLLLLIHFFLISLEIHEIIALLLCMSPIPVYFFWWAALVWKNSNAADFKHTMRMNLIASLCTNIGFIVVLIMNESF
jgi:1,4-dihydroxy-2-naphthoate octaprenyltransferase